MCICIFFACFCIYFLIFSYKIDSWGGAGGAPHPLVYQFYKKKIKKYIQKHKKLQTQIKVYKILKKYIKRYKHLQDF